MNMDNLYKDRILLHYLHQIGRHKSQHQAYMNKNIRACIDCILSNYNCHRGDYESDFINQEESGTFKKSNKCRETYLDLAFRQYGLMVKNDHNFNLANEDDPLQCASGCCDGHLATARRINWQPNIATTWPRNTQHTKIDSSSTIEVSHRMKFLFELYRIITDTLSVTLLVKSIILLFVDMPYNVLGADLFALGSHRRPLMAIGVVSQLCSNAATFMYRFTTNGYSRVTCHVQQAHLEPFVGSNTYNFHQRHIVFDLRQHGSKLRRNVWSIIRLVPLSIVPLLVVSAFFMWDQARSLVLDDIATNNMTEAETEQQIHTIRLSLMIFMPIYFVNLSIIYPRLALIIYRFIFNCQSLSHEFKVIAEELSDIVAQLSLDHDEHWALTVVEKHCHLSRSVFHRNQRKISKERLTKVSNTNLFDQMASMKFDLCDRIAALYLKHDELCEILTISDGIWSRLVRVYLLSSSVVILLSIFCALHVNCNGYHLFVMASFAIFFVILLTTVATNSISLTTEAHRPVAALEYLMHNIRLPENTKECVVDFYKRVQGLPISYTARVLGDRNLTGENIVIIINTLLTGFFIFSETFMSYLNKHSDYLNLM
ncbi:hypothetical protein GZH46_02348, partial [Fragariocoptes setiger]